MRRFLLRLLLPAVLVALAGSSAHAQDPPEEPTTQADRLFVRALTEAYLGDYERATELLVQVLTLRPDEPAVFAALAESYEALDRPAEALLYAQRAVDAAPDEPSFLTLLAQTQSDLGDAEGALASYRALLALTPGDHDARYAMGRLLERTGQHREALAAYADLIERTGEDAALRLRMEALYNRLGETSTALAMLEAATAAFPDEAMLWIRLGLAYREAERADDALDAFRRLHALDPTDPQALDFLASQLDGMRRHDEARALRATQGPETAPEGGLREAALLYARADEDPAAAAEARALLAVLADEPGVEPEALFMLGDLAYRDKDFAAAAEVLVRALDADPRRLAAWEQAAAAALYSGQPRRAIDLADEALILFPGQVGLLRLKSYAYAKSGDPASAIAPLDEALAVLAEEQPEAVDLRVRLLSFKGAILAENGDTDGAFAAFDEALVLNDAHPLLLNNYAYILAEADLRLDEALVMAERAVEADPDNPYFLDTLGWVLFKRDRLADAAAVIERAIGYDDGFAILYEHLGDVYAAMGNSPSARAAWQRAAELDPANESVRRKLQGS